MEVVSVDRENEAWRQESVDYLHELAERVKNREIREFVVVSYALDAGPGFERFGHFEDRWRILGVIEYAKGAVERAE